MFPLKMKGLSFCSIFHQRLKKPPNTPTSTTPTENQDSGPEVEGKRLLRPSVGGVATSDWPRGEGSSLRSIVNRLVNFVKQVFRIVPLRRKDSEIRQQEMEKLSVALM